MPSAVATLNSTNVRKTMRARRRQLGYALALAWQRLRLTAAAAVSRDKAVDIASRLFTAPPRHPHPPREVELLATASGFVVSTAWNRIAAWRFGRADRPAVILSHGWGGRGAQLGALVPAFLDAGYQVVLFDHVGHGLSEGRESTLVHFIKGLDAVVQRVEAEGARVVAMVGHSLGAAAVAAWLNETRREMRVVLIAPPTSVQRYSGLFARRLGIAEPVRRAMQERFERRLGYRWEDFELPRSVANVRAQALVIHDVLDRDVVPASGLALARSWRGARWLGTEGLGHYAILRDPAVVADTLDFIADRVTFAPPPRAGEAAAFGAPAPLA